MRITLNKTVITTLCLMLSGWAWAGQITVHAPQEVYIQDEKHGPGEYGWGGAASTHFWIHPEHELIVIALSQLQPYSDQLQKAVKPLIYEALP